MMFLQAAITELADMGCLDRPAEDALITPLGFLAMALPCELRLCRLLYFGMMVQQPCDAIALTVGLTAADPFSTPSLLVLKDQREYCKKLDRSFAARLQCDEGMHSEPMMLRNLFVAWIQAGAPRGRSMSSFARDYSVIPKKFDALACEAVDVCTRLCKLLRPRTPGHDAIRSLLGAMRFSVDRREELVKSGYPSNAEYQKLFTEDTRMCRAMLCAAFSDQMMLALKPRWVSGDGKKRKEEQMVAIMKKHGLNNRGTVCIMNPPQELRVEDAEENHQKLCETICGERARQVHWDEKEKLLFLDFVGPPEFTRGRKGGRSYREEDEEEEPMVLKDACPAVHRMHQFGAGRWKFTVENPLNTNGESSDWVVEAPQTIELLKPLQPFLLNWEVLQHTIPEDGGSKKAKKPAIVKAMPDWRNPMGFACHCTDELPAQEHIGVCASVQGLESGGSAFVAGASILGLNHLPLLLMTLDPAKWQVQWGFDAYGGEVRAIKILHYEIVLPPETLTMDVIWKVNEVRKKILESLTPWEEEEEVVDRKRPGLQYLWVENIKEQVADLLEDIWPEPDRVVKAKKLQWCSAIGEPISDVLTPLQPVAEELEVAMPSGAGKNGDRNGNKKAKGQKAHSQNGVVKAKQGIRASEADTVGKIISWLRERPHHEAPLSHVSGCFRVSRKVLHAYPEFLRCTPMKGKNNEDLVQLVAATNGYSDAPSRGRQAPTPAAPLRSQRALAISASESATTTRIEQLCRDDTVSCRPSDFDKRVKSWFRNFEQRRGHSKTDAAFQMLGQWCSRKEREEVRKWPAYIMKLLQEWENREFPDEEALGA
mmetsp:Transcript_122828/g.244314  ORF Transcript_122828/g.244314 Transcript_122828/m.244314 type:complete len:823 (-) Transcript_122828:135-2603(-)